MKKKLAKNKWKQLNFRRTNPVTTKTGFYKQTSLKQIANNPMELNCPQHENMDDILIIGENCLKDFLKDNNNSCPIEPHNNCQYFKTKMLQKFIENLPIMCLKQFQQDVNVLKKKETPGKIECNFKGELKDLQHHFDNECPFTLIDYFKSSFDFKHEIFILICRIKNLRKNTFKYHSDIETIKKDFIHQQEQLKTTVKSLEEKNSKLKRKYQRLK
ncbi:hypothetical protein RFI_37241, partial [Reticulomyxa filosa]